MPAALRWESEGGARQWESGSDLRRWGSGSALQPAPPPYAPAFGLRPSRAKPAPPPYAPACGLRPSRAKPAPPPYAPACGLRPSRAKPAPPDGLHLRRAGSADQPALDRAAALARGRRPGGDHPARTTLPPPAAARRPASRHRHRARGREPRHADLAVARPQPDRSPLRLEPARRRRGAERAPRSLRRGLQSLRPPLPRAPDHRSGGPAGALGRGSRRRLRPGLHGPAPRARRSARRRGSRLLAP